MIQNRRIECFRAFLLVVFSLTPLAGIAQKVSFEPVYPPISGIEVLEKEISQLVNEEREKQRLSTLIYDSKLELAARQHSKEMGELNYFSHTSPIAKNHEVRDRVRNAGLTEMSMAENIFTIHGYNTNVLPTKIVEGWMLSPGHRRNILNRDFTHTGVGVTATADGIYYATQVFVHRDVELHKIEVYETEVREYILTICLKTEKQNEIGIFLDNQHYSTKEVHSIGFFIVKMVFKKYSGIHTIDIGIRSSGSEEDFLDLVTMKIDTYKKPSESIISREDHAKLKIIYAEIEEKCQIKYELELAGNILSSGNELMIFTSGKNHKVVPNRKGYFQIKLQFNKSSGIREVSFGIRRKGSEDDYSITNSTVLDTDKPIEKSFIRNCK